MNWRERRSAWVLGLLGVFALFSLAFGHFFLTSDNESMGVLARVYEIPPTFGGERAFYGFVLGLMLFGDALAFGAFIENIRFLLTNSNPAHHPVKVLVINEALLLGAILVSTVPDVVVLMTWGELMAPSYAVMSKVDRMLDGVAALLFCVFVYRRQRARPALLFVLQSNAIPIDLEPTWRQLRPKLAVALVVAVISFGVAFGK